jgi:hypothetical protein
MSWKRQADDIYLFRNNRWYRDDELEVPNDLLRAWMVEFARLDRDRPALPFREAPLPEDYVQRVLSLRIQMLSKLTPWQLANGLKYFMYRPWEGTPLPFGPEGHPTFAAMTGPGRGAPIVRGGAVREPGPEPHEVEFPFAALADTVLGDGNTLRFYAGLNSRQRADLLAGRLHYAALNAEQQQMARYLTPMLPYALTGTQKEGGLVQLSLETRISGGFAGFGVTMERIWMERSGVGRLLLGIPSPARFVNDDVRHFEPSHSVQ